MAAVVAAAAAAARLEQGAGSRSRAGERPELGEASGGDPRRRYLYPADITGPSCSGTAGGCWGGRLPAPAPRRSPAGTAGPQPPHGPPVAHTSTWAPLGTPRPLVSLTDPHGPLHAAPSWAASLGEQGEDRGQLMVPPPDPQWGAVPPHRGAQADRWCWGERRGLSHSHHHLPLLEPRPHVLVGTLPKLAVGTPKCPRAPLNVPGTTLTCPMARGPGSAPRLGPDNSDPPPPRPAPQRGAHRGGPLEGATWGALP